MTTQAVVSARAVRRWAAGRDLPPVAGRVGRDIHLLLALALVSPILVVQVAGGLADWRLAVGLSVGFVGAQALLGRRPRPVPAAAWDVARLLLALAYVTATSRMSPVEGGTPPLLLLYVPIVVLAAMTSTRAAVVVGGAALLAYFLEIAALPAMLPQAQERGVSLAATAIILSVLARRTVASLERALVSMREAMAADRRRGTQLAAVEEVGAILARAGPTDDALAGVMALLADRFGHRFVSIYLGDRNRMRMGAQRGYEAPIMEFEPTTGVIGRVMRTGEPALVPDVRLDRDYVAARDDVGSLLSVPLLAGGELLGIVNVETEPPVRLDERDLAALRLVGDRLASALALARERERLARRVRVFERLTVFAQSLTTTLEPQALYERIPPLVSAVVACDAVSLTIRDDPEGEYRVVAMPGGDDRFVGSVIAPGEGMTGRAILERELVVDEQLQRARFPSALRAARVPDQVAIAAVPLIREDDVVGALALVRYMPDRPFDELDREVLPLIGSQTALAIANARLHHAATEASIRDPLTGLYNRRHLDASLERMSAARRRYGPDERRPVAVVLFDLDHFGRFNKRYGHGAGDAVLRVFARIVRERARASDLLARFGGEEFVVVLDGASRDEAVRFAEEVRTSFEASLIDGPNGEVLRATVSAGCAGLDREAASLSGLLVTADVGLAMAKAAGRDRVVAA